MPDIRSALPIKGGLARASDPESILELAVRLGSPEPAVRGPAADEVESLGEQDVRMLLRLFGFEDGEWRRVTDACSRIVAYGSLILVVPLAGLAFRLAPPGPWGELVVFASVMSPLFLLSMWIVVHRRLLLPWLRLRLFGQGMRRPRLDGSLVAQALARLTDVRLLPLLIEAARSPLLTVELDGPIAYLANKIDAADISQFDEKTRRRMYGRTLGLQYHTFRSVEVPIAVMNAASRMHDRLVANNLRGILKRSPPGPKDWGLREKQAAIECLAALGEPTDGPLARSAGRRPTLIGRRAEPNAPSLPLPRQSEKETDDAT